MRQVLHIFSKDVRCLWPQILVTCALFGTFDILEILSSPLQTPATQRINNLSGMLTLLLTLAIWYLVALAVYQEALPGQCQFWLTRPYSRGKLLAAKVLFIVVCVNVLLFFSDYFILSAQGFSSLATLPQLVLRQFAWSALFILPSFAIATVTRGVAQFVLAWFVLLLSVIAQSLLMSAFYRTGGMAIGFEESLVVTFVGVAAIATIVWQYAKRHTIAGRLVLIGIAFLGLPALSCISRFSQYIPGFPPAPEAQSKGPKDIQIVYDFGRANRTALSSPERVRLLVPIRVEGLPPETLLDGNGLTTVEAGGNAWPAPNVRLATSIERRGDQYWQALETEIGFLDALKSQAASVQSSLQLRLVTDTVQSSVPVTKRSFRVPNLGRCYSYEMLGTTQLACRAGLSFQNMSVRIDNGVGTKLVIADFSKSSLPFGLSPTFNLQAGPVSTAKRDAHFEFVPRRELVRFQRNLSFRGIDLSTYVVGR